ncbi:hypothetical protein BURKHO8Y_210538 [Burkholderia sp. 8Y]|nr:hypothetical protein BURKHO8Y_210538 [Burkholderia sp. 8Y]
MRRRSGTQASPGKVTHARAFIFACIASQPANGARVDRSSRALASIRIDGIEASIESIDRIIDTTQSDHASPRVKRVVEDRFTLVSLMLASRCEH